MIEQIKILFGTFKQYFVDILLGTIAILTGLLWFQSSRLKRVQIQLIQSHYDAQSTLYDAQVNAAEDALQKSEDRLKSMRKTNNEPPNAA
jgi:hypothetical protein